MFSGAYQRGVQLYEIKRYEEASKEFTNILSTDPDNYDAMYMLAHCRLSLNDLEGCSNLTDSLIGHAPDFAPSYHLKSIIELEKDNWNVALSWIEEAIRLQPTDANYWGIKARILLNVKEYHQALEAAEKGLVFDPEDSNSLNSRTQALVKLGRKQEAFKNIGKSLETDPEDDFTHANAGWAALEAGNHTQAKEHFRMALKRNPNFGLAQEGMKEAIKATNPLYRAFLNFQFWLGKMKVGQQWAVIIGLYIGFRILRGAAKNIPILVPIVYLVAGIFLMTWLITPISNIILRFNKDGRYLLTKDERLGATLTAISLSIGVVFVVAHLIFDNNDGFIDLLLLGFMFIALAIPLGSMMTPTSKTAKNKLILYTAALACLIFISIAVDVLNIRTGLPFLIFLIGIIAYQWIFNAVAIKSGNPS